MSDEIKEILDTPMFIIDDEGFTVYINDIINDYITNLQEENKFAKEYEKQYRITKSRNEKAIEYIKSNRWRIDNHIEFNKQHLLNILEGDKDE